MLIDLPYIIRIIRIYGHTI